jgi:hypothetical protein
MKDLYHFYHSGSKYRRLRRNLALNSNDLPYRIQLMNNLALCGVKSRQMVTCNY